MIVSEILASVKALAISEGFNVRQSPSGSLYISTVAGYEWRISGHQLDDERNVWIDRQIIIREADVGRTARGVLETIIRGPIDWYTDSL